MENTKLPKILADIEAENTKAYKIKIWARKQKKGYHLYLIYFLRRKRQKKATKVFITAEPETYKQDYQYLRLVLRKRDLLEENRLEDALGFDLTKDKRLDIDFIAFVQKISEEKRSTNFSIMVKHLNDYRKILGMRELLFRDLNESFFWNFQNYLLNKEKSQKNGTICPNTVKSYMRYLNVMINAAVDRKIIPENYNKRVTLKAPDPVRNFLDEAEIIRFREAKSKFKNTQNAFLFGCFSGLRLSDIRNLTFSDINQGYLQFVQKKTGRPERMKLSLNALKIIAEQRSFYPNAEIIFPLTIIQNINNQVKKIIKQASIPKYITFHCSRHTFATYLLTKGIGIYTVSKLLGHRNINNTLIYAKLVDSVKDEAIDSLPEII